jgi:SAM-dependent methyltransferase
MPSPPVLAPPPGVLRHAAGSGKIRPGRLALSSTELNEQDLLEADRGQIKSRERVRDLAEVYTHKREVDGMLDLVAGMFPSAEDPGNTDRTFLEPACGSGNFLEEILRRKLAFVTTSRYGRGERYEHRILRCLASIYGIDINAENVAESRDRLRAVVNSHLDNDLNTQAVSPAFAPAAEVILKTNIIQADALADADTIELVAYHPGRSGTFTREWSRLDEGTKLLSLFSLVDAPKRDERAVHYSQLADHPGPVMASSRNGAS